MSNTAPSVKDTGDRAAVSRSGDSDAARSKLFAGGSVLGAAAMSSCCILPLVFFSLGATGAWIGNLTALYPYRPYFLVATALLLAGGFYFAYRKPALADCDDGACAVPVSRKVTRSVLWSSAALLVAALVFPYITPWILDS